MYSRYGLYFRFTALQTVCKYDQLNPGKKKVLSFTLKENSNQELIIGTNFHLLKFAVTTQPLILNFFYLQRPHGLLQKWWRNSLGLQSSCSRQMSTDVQVRYPHPSHFTSKKGRFSDRPVCYILVGSFCFRLFVGIPVLSNSSFSLMYSCLHSSKNEGSL